MKFVNRGEYLRKYMERWPGDYNTRYLYEEMANINEGIAEILNLLQNKEDSIDYDRL